MNFKIVRAVFKKDLTSLAAMAAIVAVLFLGNAIISRLDLLPTFQPYSPPVLLVGLVVLLLSVFQNDSPASLTDDSLCRPVPKRELLTAKILLVLGAVYLPSAIGTVIADQVLGLTVMESLLDAVLLPDEVLLFLLPALLFIAIVTRSLIQGFGVLFAIFILVFVVPTPLVREPGPLDPGIGEGWLFSGMRWLSTAPAVIATILLVAVGVWLVYWRRQLARARVLLAGTLGVALLFVLMPTAMLPWNLTFSLQKAFGPSSPADDTSQVSLRTTRACFPATHRSALLTDTAFGAAVHGNGLKLWEDEALSGVDADSVAFLTDVEPRGLPLDWRVRLNYVAAEYSSGSTTLYSLRPARYFQDRFGGGALSHAWMLPSEAVQRLQRGPTQLLLTYSLTLMKPREHRLPTDGRRHALPGLGYCSAVVDESYNRIDVECFGGGSSPAQISAELNEIPASRVYGLTDLAPSWVRWPYSRRAKLAIASPRLARRDSITVTAWDAAGYQQASLTAPGILGADLTTCPLPVADASFQPAHWRDAAPHQARQVNVDEGVQLEVLDFGGTGSPILLLPGLGATAHSYDDLAPLLARNHRVVAVTRRGTGYSSKPDFGFDTPRLGQDVLEVMRAMELERVLLVGHSISGDELTWLGGHHPERFTGLVYLDAAYDRSGDRRAPATIRLRELGRALPPEPPLPSEALRDFGAMSALLASRGHAPYPEGELIAFFRINSPYVAGTPNIDARTQQAIAAAIQPPDYARVKIPALAIYAFEDPDKALPPWYGARDERLRATLAEIARIKDATRRESIESFRTSVARGQVLELRHSTHNLILSNPQEVLEAIEEFSAQTESQTSLAGIGSPPRM